MELAFHRPPNKYIGGVSIKVEDLKRSIAFYHNLLGFKILEQKENKVVFSAEDEKESVKTQLILTKSSFKNCFIQEFTMVLLFFVKESKYEGCCSDKKPTYFLSGHLTLFRTRK